MLRAKDGCPKCGGELKASETTDKYTCRGRCKRVFSRLGAVIADPRKANRIPSELRGEKKEEPK